MQRKKFDVLRNKKKKKNPGCLTRRIYYFVLTGAWNFPNEYVHRSGDIGCNILFLHSLRARV